MTNRLKIVKDKVEQQQATVEDLLALLGPEHLDAIDAKVKLMREAYNCPLILPDYEAFKDNLRSFFAYYEKTFYNVDYTRVTDKEFYKQRAYDFAEKHLRGYQGGLRAAERNSVAGREGGFIGVVDTLTDAINKLHTELYIKAVFFEVIAPSDYELRFRLATELLQKFGPLLFPGEELVPAYLLGTNLEELFHSFVTNLHAIRRDWRR